MEFGKVDPNTLDAIDFTLPADPAGTTAILQATNHARPEIFVGCAKWGRKDWVGKVYPPGTRESDFLEHYARHFNCIEMNATFYRMPTVSQTNSWREKVGPDFKFCPKFTEDITHGKRLKDVQELTDRFLEGIAGFQNNLGPIFLMPHPSMGPQTQDTLEAFLKALPRDLDVFVEFRNTGWFSDPQAFKSVFEMLTHNHYGSVISDASGRRDCVHMRLTTPEAFIRFVGNGLHPTDYTRIDAWVQRIKQWMGHGIQKIYFFMHQHDELHSPELIKYFIAELNKHCGTNVREPAFIPQQSTLFDLPPMSAPTGRRPSRKF
ncbi:DUF72 domain-containing protein [Parachryseolinea silvisoli]|uniref:DUF72 domain-containing protein n=1 Tax=Parachryseolinea silvisoli TaxID=2873601 RepID=UPI0022659240|nr:DUF72 domain-containing protein [Parachryseolinea silvisoli]MCD9014040.1 DUF72 domain-containing protein [Parachryseolinea silvisoli]